MYINATFFPLLYIRQFPRTYFEGHHQEKAAKAAASKEAEIKAVNTMKKDELLTKAAGMGLEVNDDDKVETLKEKIIAELSK